MTATNKPWRLSLCLFGLAVCLLLSGCLEVSKNSLDFLKEYRKAAEVTTIRNGYRITTMALTPEYLVAKRARGVAESSNVEKDSLMSRFSGSNYVSVTISPETTTGTNPGNADILNSAAREGRGAFAKRLDLLQNKMLEKCFLEMRGGEKVFASSYALERNWGLGEMTSFLFAFPKTWNNTEINVDEASLVITEFGLSFGRVQHPLRKPTRLKLKV